MRAEERSQRQTPYSGMSHCFYLTSVVLPDTYQDLEAESTSTKLSHSEPVPADECCIAFNDSDNKLWVMLKTGDANTVEYKNLTPSQKTKFNVSRKKEIQNLLDLRAYRILSVEESIRFREQYPEYALPSKWVDRWKATDEGGLDAKSRIVIL